MSETARRLGGGHGSDLARRLVARPIRLQAELGQHAEGPRASNVTAFPSPIVGDAAETAAEPADVSHAIEAHIQVMRAVIEAERRENARLRAVLGLDDDAPLGPEAQAVRARWSGLVDSLLQAAS